MNSCDYHIPVMLKETLDLLICNRDGVYLDCTLGGGGHAKAILERISPKGYLIGIDRDDEAIKESSKKLSGFDNFKAHKIRFSRVTELDEIVFGMKFDGILLDIGVSSKQIDDPERGFSYSENGPLDMRMDSSNDMTAYDIISDYDENELADIFYNFGEERRSRQIAKALCRARDEKTISTTGELREIISSVTPGNHRTKTLSRIFQAVRIELNRELDELKDFLNISLDIMKEKGRTAVISYHSLEDRIVKQFINERSKGCICPPEFPKCVCGKVPEIKKITQKTVQASAEERGGNIRARSAKLRVYESI